MIKAYGKEFSYSSVVGFFLFQLKLASVKKKNMFIFPTIGSSFFLQQDEKLS